VTASVAGIGATRLRIYTPPWGPWWIEAQLEEESSLAGRVEIVAADRALSGTIVSGGVSGQGRSSYYIVAGAGGWATKLAPQGYHDPNGVKVATILEEAATACGEAFDGSLPAADIVGTSWLRDNGPASRVLDLVSRRAWHMTDAGLTKLGRRPAVSVVLPDAMELGPIDRATGSREIRGEQIADILPGAIVDGLEVVEVETTIGGASVRSVVYFASPLGADGQIDLALEAAIDRIFPWLRYARGPFEFRVVTQSEELLDLQPVLASIGLDDLHGVVVRPGIPGVRADVALGSRVLVSFVHADPSRPVVVGFEDPDSDGFVPTALDLADAGGWSLRDGDLASIVNPDGSDLSGPLAPLSSIPLRFDLHSTVRVNPGDPGIGRTRVRT
jgi:hypothetical protein